MSDPFNWGGYPSADDLAEPTREEQIQAAVDAEDSRLADADWGDES